MTFSILKVFNNYIYNIYNSYIIVIIYSLSNNLYLFNCYQIIFIYILFLLY